MANFTFNYIRDLTSPTSLKLLNDNFENLRLKLFGEITGSDIKSNTIATQNIKDLAVDSAKIGNLAVKSAHIDSAQILSVHIGNAQITNAHISNLVADRIKADKIDVLDLTSNTAFINNLNANTGFIDTLSSNLITSKNFITTSAVIDGSQIKNASITSAQIVSLNANLITAGTLAVDRLIIRGATNSLVYQINNISGALQSQNVNTLNGEVLTPRTIAADKIVANSITGNEIKAATVTANNMVAGTITAASGIIANAAITNAMIVNLTADKIQGGTLILGGNANGNGLFNLRNASNVVISTMDKDGIRLNDGYIQVLEDITTYGGSAYKNSIQYASKLQFNVVSPSGSRNTYYGGGGWSISDFMTGVGGNSSFTNDGSNVWTLTTGGQLKLNPSSSNVNVLSDMVVNGKISTGSTSYPNLYGNGSVLQLSHTNVSSAGLVLEANACRPATDNADWLGVAAQRWKQLYAGTSAISTSDRNEKNTIIPLDDIKIKDFIMAINTVSYKFNDGDSDRIHYGMIAQDVEEMLALLGMTTKDFAGFIKTPKENGDGYYYGLRYEEFIAPLIKIVQMQQSRIESLENKLAS